MNDEFLDLESDGIARQAGEWLLELEARDVSVQRIAQWQQWMAADERHRRAYDEMQAMWRGVDLIGRPQWPAQAEVERDGYEPSQAVSTWRARRPGAAPSLSSRALKGRAVVRRLWRGGLAAAAALALAAIGLQVAATLSTSRVLTIETATAQNRDVQLADGSQISVGAGSVLKVAMDERLRSVTLERGEAYFTVARDAARPFQVRAGEAAVTAIGTAFNVRRAGSRVVVAVSEGAVNVDATGMQAKAASGSAMTPGAAASTRSGVSSTRLNAGQRLTLEAASAASVGKMAAIDPIAPQAVAGWRQGRLQFSGEPLFIALEDINRYALHPITIGDPAIRELRVTGTVSAGNVDSWLKSLEKALPVRVIATGGGTSKLVGR